MKSTGNYPIFQDKRDEMDLRPLRYKCRSTIARFTLEDWKERGYDLKHNAMVAQKREPVFWAGPAFHKSLGSTWSGMEVK